MTWPIALSLIALRLIVLAFFSGFWLALKFARSEMERLADQLTDTRNRLFTCGQKLSEAERHLHGDRG